MRALLIETKDEQTVNIEIVQRTSDLSFLIELGMNLKDLVKRGVTDFTTTANVSYKVTALPVGSYVPQAPITEGLNGAVIWTEVSGNV